MENKPMDEVLDAILNLKRSIKLLGYESGLIKIEVTKDVGEKIVYHLIQRYSLNGPPEIDQDHKIKFCGVEIEDENKRLKVNIECYHDKLFEAYEEARADNTAHFRTIMELEKRVKDAEYIIENLQKKCQGLEAENKRVKLIIEGHHDNCNYLAAPMYCNKCGEFSNEKSLGEVNR